MTEAASSFPAIVQMVDLTGKYGTPTTHGGRRIYAVRISDNVTEEEDEPAFLQGEQNRSEPRFGRYHVFLPAGDRTLRFSHIGYVTQDVPVTVTGSGIRIEVALARDLSENGGR